MINVIEIQETNGTAKITSYSFADREQAEQKYHQILSTAAVCTHDIHSATMLTSEGYYVKSEHFEHIEEGKAAEEEK